MNTTPPVLEAKKSHKGSITGFVLAILSLGTSAIGSALIHTKYKPNGPTSGSLEKEVGNAVATGTNTFLTTIFGVPLLVIGISLSLLSLSFIVFRLMRVRAGGLIFSILAGALAIWSLMIAIGAFQLLKAN